MNNLITCLYKKSKIILLGFILLSCLYPLRVNASGITASVETLEISSVFFSDLIRLGFLSGGVFPKDSTITDFTSYLDNEYSVFDAYDVDISDITITKAPDGWLDNLNNSIGTIYGENGIISSDSQLYMGHIDNGFFEGDFYCDANGNILASDSSLASLLFNVKYGGNTYSNYDWQNWYNTFIEDVNNFHLNYSSNENIDLTIPTSFYTVVGTIDNYGGTSNIRLARKIYIDNIYDTNLFYVPTSAIRTNSTTGHLIPNYIYCVNNPSEYLSDIYFSNNSNYTDNVIYDYLDSRNLPRYDITTNTVNGVTYNYILYTYSNNTYGSYNTFLSYDQGYKTFLINYNDFSYDFNMVGNNDIVTFIPTESKTIDLTDTFGYSNVKSNISALDDSDVVNNNSFTYDESISLDNPAVFIPDEDVNVVAPSIPFPGVIPDEEDTTANPALTYDESIQPEMTVAIDSFQNLEIPFITNLQNRYPFSIPWDIAKFIGRFRNTPTPPAWDFDWSITIGANTYTKHFQGDLSDFNSLAEIFRNLVLISFIIALCKFSYDHHF